jgi:hypothetical protein
MSLLSRLPRLFLLLGLPAQLVGDLLMAPAIAQVARGVSHGNASSQDVPARLERQA